MAYAAGRVAALQGEWEPSLELFKRALQANGRLAGAVIDLYVTVGRRPDLAVRLVEGNPDAMIKLADLLETTYDTPEDGPPPQPVRRMGPSNLGRDGPTRRRGAAHASRAARGS